MLNMAVLTKKRRKKETYIDNISCNLFSIDIKRKKNWFLLIYLKLEKFNVILQDIFQIFKFTDS